MITDDLGSGRRPEENNRVSDVSTWIRLAFAVFFFFFFNLRSLHMSSALHNISIYKIRRRML